MTARLSITAAVISLLLPFVEVGMALAENSSATSLRVYIGTNSAKGLSKGIYRCQLDLSSGKLSEPEVAAEAVNPGFLAIHPNRKFLYAIGSPSGPNREQPGFVTAYAIDSANGDLRQLNQQSAGGPGPCFVTVDRTGSDALVANYGGGSCGVLPIADDGSLKPMSTFIQHEGSSVDTERQAHPHAHSINLDPTNRFAVVADLGLDKVLVYKFDPAKGSIAPNDPPSVSLAPRAGPRHFAFHPDGRHAYVINELNSTVTAFEYDSQRGVLTTVQSISTLPQGVDAASVRNSTAEVVVHPSGKFLYGSNRGHNSIAIFSIDSASGKLTALGHATSGIKVPRNFNVDPSGSWLLVANQEGDNVNVFRIDAKTGMLEPTGQAVSVPRPMCIKFWTPAT